MTSPFAAAHRLHVKSLYKRMLKNSLDWTIERPLWRREAIQIRAEFERNRLARHLLSMRPGSSPHRNVHDPRALAQILEKAEADLQKNKHPDPYICELSYVLAPHPNTDDRRCAAPMFPGGTKW